MASIRDLDKPPIKEAIIDIRLNLPNSIPLEALLSLQSKLPEQYSEMQPTVRQDLGLHFQQGSVQARQQESLIGYRSVNQSSNFVVQFQSTGFSISKLAPYDSWDDFRKESIKLWDIYSASLPTYEISRLAVRFINQLDLPVEQGLNLDSYLTSCPKIPENMGQQLAGFFTRLLVPVPEQHATAIVIQNLEKPINGKLPVILDFDIFREERLNLSNKEIWEYFDTLRTVKNNAFFGSLTDKALELCK